MSINQATRVLVVDDETPQMQALCSTLRMEGYETTGYSSPRRALAALQPNQFELLLTDLMMPEMDGISFLAEARKIDDTLAAVVMTGHGAIDTAVRAMQNGALDYIVKPFRLNVILTVLTRALDMRRLKLQVSALQRREREYVAELESANGQLESFAHSISHDLRSPLNAIVGFCEWYIDDYGHLAPPAGQELLQHVVGGAKRMDQLINDLLRFCRLGRQALSKTPVNTDELLSRVLQPLRAANDSRHIELRIATLPPCHADISLLEQVFVNLLSNAYKFTGKCDLAVIEVGSTNHNGETVYFVRDNGAGFDMKYVHKLFGVFQRLHAPTDFEGTGVGLSIVKQIVTRHGGRIWADGRPDQGATFNFTLAPGRDIHS